MNQQPFILQQDIAVIISSDYYSLREKYQNLKQEQENSVVYLRKVMRLYFISKNLEPPSELRLVLNEAVQKDCLTMFHFDLFLGYSP